MTIVGRVYFAVEVSLNPVAVVNAVVSVANAELVAVPAVIVVARQFRLFGLDISNPARNPIMATDSQMNTNIKMPVAGYSVMSAIQMLVGFGWPGAGIGISFGFGVGEATMDVSGFETGPYIHKSFESTQHQSLIRFAH